MIDFRSDRLPHALLITGNIDLIQTELYADLKALLCENLDSNLRSNDHCTSCTLFASPAGHPDLLTLRPEGKLNAIKIDSVREVIGFLEQSAWRGGMRIVVLMEADTLNIASQNALLKSLEEPGTRTLIVLVTAKPHLLLPTVKSRCQNLHLESSSAHQHHTLIDSLLSAKFDPLTFIETNKELDLLDCVHTQMALVHDMMQKHCDSVLSRFYQTLAQKSALLQKKVAINQELFLFELALAWRKIILGKSYATTHD